MIAHELEHTPLLFGRDHRTGIVAVEPAGHFVRLFFRSEDGVRFHDEPFRPFILVSDPALLAGCRVPSSVVQLQGEGAFRWHLLFDSWGDCLTARDFLASSTGKSPGAADAPYLFIPDLSQQYLLSTGTTLFKGMEFGDLATLTLDIETFCGEGHRFSNPDRPEDRIISIALWDSKGAETVLAGDLLSEREMLQELTALIQTIDPDVIIGHNIFRFDLDYIGRRAERLGMKLAWGRNGSCPHVTPRARWKLAERWIEFPRWDIHGRHIIDTYFLVLHYDLARRELESHGLKPVARHFGLAAPDRTELPGDRIAAQFTVDPQVVYRYNLDDVRETEALYRLLGYAWFLQTRIFPYSFQNCPLKGNATRINTLFLREYLHQRQAIPARAPEGEGAEFEGGYTALLREGICGPLVHCDVASLYPSLMLIYRLKPAGDSLGLFLPILSELRRFRLEAKQRARDAADEAGRQYYEALQQVFKVLINSFFGYLGSPLHNFSDMQAAAEVTRLGRVTIREMIAALQREGAAPVEVDTDGIYFQPPAGCEDEESQRGLVARISAALPEGIEVELAGRYRSMFAYKTKNYALMDHDGRIVIRGSSLRSRGMERYLREFLREAVGLLLTSGGSGIDAVYDRYVGRLVARSFAIDWVSRTETLNETPAAYTAKLAAGRRNRSAAMEIALAAENVCRPGDQISYYVCGSAKDVNAWESCRPAASYDPRRPDVNIAYYIEKLRHLKRRFEPYLPKEPTLFDL